jgi:radical SAM protein (TIGR01212 family)
MAELGRAAEAAPRFNRHAAALRARHGMRVWRIGLDGGFSCPNREGGRGGCAYCAPDASRSAYIPAGRLSISAQVEAGLAFLRRRYRAELFFPYFQAFSSTFGPASLLRSRYDEALDAVRAMAPGSLRGLVVATRPDCLDWEGAELLASYARQGLEVWVELGLQSAHERTLRRIGRGHGYAAFEAARALLAGRGIRTAVHLILGLPGEGRSDMLETVELVASTRPEGVKFHDLLLPRGSAFAAEYLLGELSLMHPARLPGLLADCLERLLPECEVMRLCADAREDETLSPFRRPDKATLYQAVEAELSARGARQGSLAGRR